MRTNPSEYPNRFDRVYLPFPYRYQLYRMSIPLTDVWMINLGQKSDLGRIHRVLLRQEQLQLEHATYTTKHGTIIHTTHLPSNGDPPGPAIVTSKYRKLSSCGDAEIPGAGSAASLSVSCIQNKYISLERCQHKP
jgi:hypothetical protein